MELNPDHPVTQEMHTEWHKILAIVMRKLGINKVSIMLEDVQSLANDVQMPVVIAHSRKESLDIILTTEAEALMYANERGLQL